MSAGDSIPSGTGIKGHLPAAEVCVGQHSDEGFERDAL